MTKPAALKCPRCRVALDVVAKGGAQTHRCPRCRGIAVTVALLRRVAPEERVQRLWSALADGTRGDPCPSCARPLVEVPPHGAITATLDACRTCQVIWCAAPPDWLLRGPRSPSGALHRTASDADELRAFSPERQTPRPARERLSPRAAEAAALGRIESKERDEDSLLDVLAVEALIEIVCMVLP